MRRVEGSAEQADAQPGRVGGKNKAGCNGATALPVIPGRARRREPGIRDAHVRRLHLDSGLAAFARAPE